MQRYPRLSKFLLGFFTAAFFLGWIAAADAGLKAVASAVLGNGTVTSAQLLAPDGSATAPSYSFTNNPTSGLFNSSGNLLISVQGLQAAGIIGTQSRFTVPSTFQIGWSSDATATTANDLILARDAANTLAQKNGANAQVNRQYFSTTGPVYWQTTARTAGALYTATGGAAQVSYAQTTVPTITANGGTSPACAGTDTAMTCTIGTAPPVAATFTVTFNGTWPAAPSCIALRGTAGTSPAVTAAVTTTTTVAITLSANLVASEKFAVHCLGVS